MIDLILTSINDLIEFMNGDFYQFLVDIFSVYVEYLLIAYVKFKIFTLTFLWSVAENILANLSISSQINSLWGSLNSSVLAYLTFFKIPECFNILINAGVTRFILRII